MTVTTWSLAQSFQRKCQSAQPTRQGGLGVVLCAFEVTRKPLNHDTVIWNVSTWCMWEESKVHPAQDSKHRRVPASDWKACKRKQDTSLHPDCCPRGASRRNRMQCFRTLAGPALLLSKGILKVCLLCCPRENRD